MDWNKVYETYPVNENMIWLNNCGITPAGLHIVKALEDYFNGFAQKGPWYAPDLPDHTRNRIKNILSGLLNCENEELALIHNTAEGMNFISYGYPVHPGEEVILLENEYPSNVYPWRELEKRGARLVVTPMEENPEQFLAEFEKRVNAKTKMAALSAVHWCTGMPLPLEEIGEICRQNKVELVVDGAQGVGMQPMDVKKSGISYMAFSAWKWLMGPLGLGVLYISRDRLGKLEPVFMATESVVDDKEYLPYKNELKATADRYTYSTPNVSEWIYLDAALKFLEPIGFEAIRNRLYELAGHLAKNLTDIGFEVLLNRFPDWPTAIVVCEKKGKNTKNLLEVLKQNQVMAAERLGRIRLSPHIYNSFEQLDKVAEILS